MQHLNIFEISYEGDSYLVGTRDEILKAHNEWLESSGNFEKEEIKTCLLYTSPSPRDKRQSRMPSSA